MKKLLFGLFLITLPLFGNTQTWRYVRHEVSLGVGVSNFLGDLGMADAGIIPLDDIWNSKTQRGILRVNNKHVNDLIASLIFVKNK